MKLPVVLFTEFTESRLERKMGNGLTEHRTLTVQQESINNKTVNKLYSGTQKITNALPSFTNYRDNRTHYYILQASEQVEMYFT